MKRRDLSPFPRTREAQKRNERLILRLVRSAANIGEGWRPLLLGLTLWRALDRLRANGRLVYDPRKFGYVERRRRKFSR